MPELKYKDPLLRIMRFLFALSTFVLGLAVLLNLNKAVIAWIGLIALTILAGEFFIIPLGFKRQHLENAWFRAAYRVGWIVFVGAGALLISATLAWAITTGLALGQSPPITEILFIVVLLLGLVGIFLIAGLAVTGYMAQRHIDRV
jgi:hypothetical protein